MEEFIIPSILSNHYQSDDFNDLLNQIIKDFKNMIENRDPSEAMRLMVSTQNYIERSQWKENPNLHIRVGDVCYIDFGSAYQLEAGYQHFGLVFSKSHGKLFVIPMSSNSSAFSQAYDPLDNPNGKKHLLKFVKSCGLKKDSTLFLNDAKFISPTRVIEVIGHLSPVDLRYKRIQVRLFETLFKTL